MIVNADSTDLWKIDFFINNITGVAKAGNVENFKNLLTVLQQVKDKALICSGLKNAKTNLISLLCEYRKKTLLSYLLHQSYMLQYFTSDNNDEHEEIMFKEDIFYKAMCSDVFEIIEMLYDYWSGDLHWVGSAKECNNIDVKKIKRLGEALKNAFKRYENGISSKLKVNLSMIFNIQGLIAFNDFQNVLYTKLNDLFKQIITWPDEPEDLVRIQETYALRKTIVTIINTYEIHQKQVQSSNKYCDTNSLISKAYFYFSHEVYFRKLDFNICLLILDNLHLLKLRLSMHWITYQQLERALYQFIYHVTSRWRLYWPKKKKMKTQKILKKYNNVSCYFTIKYDANKWEAYYYIIFLERRNFEKNINDFKNILLDTNIEENIKKAGSKPNDKDVNSLILLPELRDHYSLKQMSQHIAQLYSIDLKNDKQYGYLLIERTLQIVGEFLKCSSESLHLEPSTEALIKAEISVKNANDLKSLRNMLCHAKKGKLLKRIDLEINRCNIFETIRIELLSLKKKIDVVINVHKPFLEKALIENSLSIMYERRNEIPEILSDIFIYGINNLELLFHDFGRFCTEILSRLKLVIQEAAALLIVYLCMQPKLTKINGTIHQNFVNKFPFYKDAIIQSLEKIKVHISDWNCAINTVKINRPDIIVSSYPNEMDTNKIISFVKETGITDGALQNFLHDTLFVEIRNHWSFIIELFKFIVFKIFDSDTNIQVEMIMKLCKLHFYDYNLDESVLIVNSCLDIIKDELNIKESDRVESQLPYFTGIRNLKNCLKMAYFLTTDEKDYLMNILHNNARKKGTMTRGNHKIKTKIENYTPIPMKEYQNFVKSIATDKKAEEILMNLVMGTKRNPKLYLCLQNRVSILRELTMNQSESQLILRCKTDKTFRVILEVLLFDIFDILENNNIVNKSGRLLTEINLRNTFTHGNPMLDIVGNVLDSNDLPRELVTKALELIKDESAVNALCTLIDSRFNFIDINSNNLTPEQNALVDTFKTSERWKDYLHLIPKSNKNPLEIQLRHKDHTKFNYNTLPDLVKAVYRSDLSLMFGIINNGTDVNFIDDNKKTAIHHAALIGYVDGVKVLLDNKADINIKNEENHMTALHYAAMYGYKEIVELLINYGADSTALDKKGRSAVYLANQRKHTNISRILLKAMKRT